MKPPDGGKSGSPVGARVGHRAGVADLCGGRGALGMDGVGEAAEPVEVVPGEEHAVAVGPAFGGNGQVGHGRHGDATGRHAAVELDEGVAHRALGHHALEGGRLDDPVAQGERAQRGGRKDLGGVGRCGRWRRWRAGGMVLPLPTGEEAARPVGRRRRSASPVRSGGVSGGRDGVGPEGWAAQSAVECGRLQVDRGLRCVAGW